nr:response regulator [Deltaproteobacteria bacterium]
MNVVDMARERFSIKVFLIFVIFIFVISASFTGFFVKRQREALHDTLINKGSLLVRLLAHNSRIGVFSENQDLLKVPVDGISEQESVLKVVVYNLDGKLLAKKNTMHRKAAGSAEMLSVSDQDLELFRKRFRNSTSSFFQESGEVVEFWAPVLAGTRVETEESLFLGLQPSEKKEWMIGFVGISLDKQLLNQQMKDLLLQSIVLGSIFIFIGSGATYIVVKGITRPLNHLTDSVKALGMGGTVEKVPVETKDEVGKLAQSFNTMAESLKKREEEKGLLEEQLRHAQKMEAIGTMAGGIAHDFNNILTTIIGYGHLLHLQIEDNQTLKYHVDQILVSAERAANLTQSLLAFSRKQLIKLRPTDLNHVVLKVEKLLTRLIREDIEIRLNLTKETLTLMADSGQIDQALMNLVTNARDAMPNGGIITISTEALTVSQESFKGRNGARPGRYAALTVSDTGCGMDEKIKERIFDPFFTTKEVGKGTGLGLSMIYGIIKQHEGFIDVITEVGKGTSFRMFFPLSSIEVELHEKGTQGQPRGGTETILIAEDDTSVRKLAKEVLERFGYTVIEAVHGDDAVKVFGENKDLVDLVLLDVVMPKRNGKQVWDDIRMKKPEMKSIFISGYTYDIIHQKGIIKGEINFVSKPISPDELLRNVREVLDS